MLKSGKPPSKQQPKLGHDHAKDTLEETCLRQLLPSSRRHTQHIMTLLYTRWKENPLVCCRLSMFISWTLLSDSYWNNHPIAPKKTNTSNKDPENWMKDRRPTFHDHWSSNNRSCYHDIRQWLQSADVHLRISSPVFNITNQKNGIQ